MTCRQHYYVSKTFMYHMKWFFLRLPIGKSVSTKYQIFQFRFSIISYFWNIFSIFFKVVFILHDWKQQFFLLSFRLDSRKTKKYFDVWLFYQSILIRCILCANMSPRSLASLPIRSWYVVKKHKRESSSCKVEGKRETVELAPDKYITMNSV